jgi:hypothetical protein
MPFRACQACPTQKTSLQLHATLACNTHSSLFDPKLDLTWWSEAWLACSLAARFSLFCQRISRRHLPLPAASCTMACLITALLGFHLRCHRPDGAPRARAPLRSRRRHGSGGSPRVQMRAEPRATLAETRRCWRRGADSRSARGPGHGRTAQLAFPGLERWAPPSPVRDRPMSGLMAPRAGEWRERAGRGCAPGSCLRTLVATAANAGWPGRFSGSCCAVRPVLATLAPQPGGRDCCPRTAAGAKLAGQWVPVSRGGAQAAACPGRRVVRAAHWELATGLRSSLQTTAARGAPRARASPSAERLGARAS